MTASLIVVGGVYLSGVIVFATAAGVLRRNGAEAGADSRAAVALVCFTWPLLLVIPKAWLDRLASHRNNRFDALVRSGAIVVLPTRRRRWWRTRL